MRFFTRPTHLPRHAASGVFTWSKPVRPRIRLQHHRLIYGGGQIKKSPAAWLTAASPDRFSRRAAKPRARPRSTPADRNGAGSGGAEVFATARAIPPATARPARVRASWPAVRRADAESRGRRAFFRAGKIQSRVPARKKFRRPGRVARGALVFGGGGKECDTAARSSWARAPK